MRKHKEDMCEDTRKQIYKMKYMQLTEEITVDVQTSKEEIKNKGKMNEIVNQTKTSNRRTGMRNMYRWIERRREGSCRKRILN